MTDTTLIVTCHPSHASLCAHITGLVHDALRDLGRTVIVEDLVAARFNPVVSPQEFEQFHMNRIPPDLETFVAHLRGAEELVFVVPVWMYGMPAILKGYFERVWRPHVAYRIEGDHIVALLQGKR